MTRTQKFIKGIGLSALLTFAASCSNGNQTDTSDKTCTLADSILNQAHSQARDSYFMENNDHIFCGTEARVINAHRDNAQDMLTRFEQQAKADSIKYADALIRDAHLFNNMKDFNKTYNRENDGYSINRVYINYCRYRRSIATLNTLKKYSNMKSK